MPQGIAQLARQIRLGLFVLVRIDDALVSWVDWRDFNPAFPILGGVFAVVCKTAGEEQ